MKEAMSQRTLFFRISFFPFFMWVTLNSRFFCSGGKGFSVTISVLCYFNLLYHDFRLVTDTYFKLQQVISSLLYPGSSASEKGAGKTEQRWREGMCLLQRKTAIVTLCFFCLTFNLMAGGEHQILYFLHLTL